MSGKSAGQERFNALIQNAQKRLTVMGINPLIPYLEVAGSQLGNLLRLNDDLRIDIIYESESENFNQSLAMDFPGSSNRTTYPFLSVHRQRVRGETEKQGLIREVAKHLSVDLSDKDARDALEERLRIRQVNLRLPINVILIDDRIFACLSTSFLPTVADYREFAPQDPWFDLLREYTAYYLDTETGGRFLSTPFEELIQMYDTEAYPRGIFPRRSFYTTEFQRYSIWGFAFNRKGELLLHQRSKDTKDNRLLWDKSTGGHVDLRDESTSITAKRELVEELILPQAEFTKYMQADIGDIIHFGEWNTAKRPESSFRDAFAALGSADWIMFRPTGDDGEPLTITRVSNRRFHERKGPGRKEQIVTRRTVFMSDVFFLIAPPEAMDTSKQMAKLVQFAKKTGAAQDHKLISISDLRDWIVKAEQEGEADATFTDDLLYVNREHRAMLEAFAEFVKFIS